MAPFLVPVREPAEFGRSSQRLFSFWRSKVAIAEELNTYSDLMTSRK
jgi:hypothetical protein